MEARRVGAARVHGFRLVEPRPPGPEATRLGAGPFVGWCDVSGEGRRRRDGAGSDVDVTTRHVATRQLRDELPDCADDRPRLPISGRMPPATDIVSRGAHRGGGGSAGRALRPSTCACAILSWPAQRPTTVVVFGEHAGDAANVAEPPRQQPRDRRPRGPEPPRRPRAMARGHPGRARLVVLGARVGPARRPRDLGAPRADPW